MHLPPISKTIPTESMSIVHDACLSSSPPDTITTEKALREIFPSTHIIVHQIIPISSHLHRLFILHISNNTRLVLKLPPSSATQVLQHERHHLASEAAILTRLSKSNLPIPQILKYDPHSRNRFNSPFLLTTHLPGVLYAELYTYLTQSELKDIEQQLHSLTYHLSASYISHTFGPAGQVASGSGFSSWREAFSNMMQAILMDGEDMTVNLPYTEVREALRVWGEWLDEVRDARLVIMGLGRRRKDVRIERGSNDVVGVMGWGGAVWADGAFREEGRYVSGKVGRRDLLYMCYHAIVSIVTSHYRPNGNPAEELDARKTLTAALAQLAVKREPV